MDAELKKSARSTAPRGAPASPRKWATPLDRRRRAVFLLLGGWRLRSAPALNAAPEVEVQRVPIAQRRAAAPQGVVLNATGYIVAAHKIQVAAKVVGKVKWIGVEKGDRVQRRRDPGPAGRRRVSGAACSRPRASCEPAGEARRGDERLASRRVAQAQANLDSAKADLRTPASRSTARRAWSRKVSLAKQALDDAQARYDSARAHASTRCRRPTSW